MFRVDSYQVADSIDLKNLKAAFTAKMIYGDSEELYYRAGPEQYVYVFRYGVISFLNYEPVNSSSFLRFIEPFCRNRFSEYFHDEFLVETGAPEYRVSHNKIEIESADEKTIRIIMLNVAQSVALDYYSEQTTRLMEETNYHTQILEKKGRLAISGRNLKKYIGKTLLLKNRITENLYIFDSPLETWEDEKLDKLYTDLKRNFELPERFRNVADGLGIVKENLELFKDLLQYRNSVYLEWIIIALIAIEVLNFLIEKIFQRG